MTEEPSKLEVMATIIASGLVKDPSMWGMYREAGIAGMAVGISQHIIHQCKEVEKEAHK